jgi:hypothetical protein
VQVASRCTDHRQPPASSALLRESSTPGLRTSHVSHPRSRPSCGPVQDCRAHASVEGALLRAAMHGGPRQLLGSARCPTLWWWGGGPRAGALTWVHGRSLLGCSRLVVSPERS